MEGHMRLGMLAILLIIVAWVIAAKPDFVETQNPAGKTIMIPEYAYEVAPGVFSLGTAVHEGKLVEGYAIVEYKKGAGKGSVECNYDGKCQKWERDKPCDDCVGVVEGSASCYSLFASGGRWRTIEDYEVNPTNTEGLDHNFVLDTMALNIDKWETAAATDIIGNGIMTNDALSVDTENPDGRNEMYFGEIEGNNIIAMAVVWGVFKGSPSQRKIVEWDQIYDQVDFEWSSSGEPRKMDFENMATHELGHSVGLEDLYTHSCTYETMYGYGYQGETYKRTLGAGDIKGVQTLYK